MRVTEENVVFVGLRGMIRKLYEYETDPASAKIVVIPERIIAGKSLNIKGYAVGGNLISNILS